MPGDVHVVGGDLAGLAAAARLARMGHQLTIHCPGVLGGRAQSQLLDDEQPPVWGDDIAPITTLPAAWRDLAKKSGRPMAGFLNAAHLELVEAPDTRHHFPDGTELVLPSDRGGQVKALEAVFGRQQALAWAELIDDLDQVWQALRRQGTEAPFDPGQAPDPALLPKKTMGQLADRLGDERLRMLFLSAASRAGSNTPAQAPALVGSRWSLDRTFGRWQLLDHDTALSQPLSRLTTLLIDRLTDAGVVIDDSEAPSFHRDVVIECVPPGEATRSSEPLNRRLRKTLARWRGRKVPEPAPRPTITRILTERLDQTGDCVELVVHHPTGHPIVQWQQAIDSDTVLVTNHDHTATTPERYFGMAIDSFDDWWNRPPLRPQETLWNPSAASHAGNEPWAELLSGALTAYEVHEHLTGEDIRPTNKLAPRPPRRTQLG